MIYTVVRIGYRPESGGHCSAELLVPITFIEQRCGFEFV
jgi:hypothetical protein